MAVAVLIFDGAAISSVMNTGEMKRSKFFRLLIIDLRRRSVARKFFESKSGKSRSLPNAEESKHILIILIFRKESLIVYHKDIRWQDGFSNFGKEIEYPKQLLKEKTITLLAVGDDFLSQ
jgi:hypothetical protein